MSELLEIKNLRVGIQSQMGKVQAVRGVDLTLKQGEVLAIVGESGCGKSILCKSIMKLLPRSAKIEDGQILINGTDIAPYSDRQMKKLRGKLFSMIFQDPLSSLNPTMTVEAQIAEAVRIHDRSLSREQVHRRVIELMNLVGIQQPEQRCKLYPYNFSGGMRQRTVMAIALAGNPRILLADEPTTALDVTIQAQILRLMNELQKENGTSIIFITHDLGVINEMADDVAVMYCGQVVEKASARLIFADCAMSHPYTEGLMFSIPRLDAIHTRIEPIPGAVPHPLDLPKGCKFAPRCKYCTQKCIEEEPGLVDVGDGQLIRCFYPEKEVRRSEEHKKITVNQ